MIIHKVLIIILHQVSDRLKLPLAYLKSTDDFDDNQFVELAVINDGVLRTKRRGSQHAQ